MTAVKKGIIFGAALAAILGAVLITFFSLGHIYLSVFSRLYNLDISYSRLRNVSFDRFQLKDFTMRDKKTGFSVFSKTASLHFRIRDMRFKDAGIDFAFKDVHFGKEGGKGSLVYDTLTGLVAAPFDSRWQYTEMSGKVKTLKDGLEIKDFAVTGKDIKVSLNGAISGNDRINFDIIIYFGKELYDKIPPEMAGILLAKEESGWSSLSVHLEGDYKTPAIQLSSKLFRLNIRAISGL